MNSLLKFGLLGLAVHLITQCSEITIPVVGSQVPAFVHNNTAYNFSCEFTDDKQFDEKVYVRADAQQGIFVPANTKLKLILRSDKGSQIVINNLEIQSLSDLVLRSAMTRELKDIIILQIKPYPDKKVAKELIGTWPHGEADKIKK